MRLSAHLCTRRRLLQKRAPGVRPLIFMVVWIPEDILSYQPLPCNYIHTSFLEYICLYVIMVLHRASLLN